MNAAVDAAAQQTPLFRVRDLHVAFPHNGTYADAVRGVNLHVNRGEVLGIVGESGCGKSVAMLAALGLQNRHARVRGSACFQGQELIGLPLRQLRQLRGARIAMIFQDPLSALNPVMRIGDQIGEVLRLHNRQLTNTAVTDRVLELLELLAIPEPQRRMRQFPHEFSGGMRQRVVIAMALANHPDLLIADEPTTALDVTVQAQIIETLLSLQKRRQFGLILITHDLGVLAGCADRVAVVYAGKVVEEACVDDLFRTPIHPYTRGLIASIPAMSEAKTRLFSIDGMPPALGQWSGGCAFEPRCAQARAICRTIEPSMLGQPRQRAACHVALPTQRMMDGGTA